MQQYKLTKEAEEDLLGIMRYTIKKWGKKQLKQYTETIKNKFNQIAKREIIGRQFSNTFPNLCVTRCEHHFIFYFIEKNDTAIIIAIIHKKMDIVTHLKKRLLEE